MRSKRKITIVYEQMIFHDNNLCSLEVNKVWKFDLQLLEIQVCFYL